APGLMSTARTYFYTMLASLVRTTTLGGGQVIRGWDEGVSGMKEGGVRKLTIPQPQRDTERRDGGVIPPNATLVFEVEL
ncbi:FKBP-type peptidyl-prolyl cis-trans isomerase, partial [Acinetobacter baumannii]